MASRETSKNMYSTQPVPPLSSQVFTSAPRKSGGVTVSKTLGFLKKKKVIVKMTHRFFRPMALNFSIFAPRSYYVLRRLKARNHEQSHEHRSGTDEWQGLYLGGATANDTSRAERGLEGGQLNAITGHTLWVVLAQQTGH